MGGLAAPAGREQALFPEELTSVFGQLSQENECAPPARQMEDPQLSRRNSPRNSPQPTRRNSSGRNSVELTGSKRYAKQSAVTSAQLTAQLAAKHRLPAGGGLAFPKFLGPCKGGSMTTWVTSQCCTSPEKK